MYDFKSKNSQVRRLRYFLFLVSIFININYVSSKNKLDLHFYKHLNTEFKFIICHLPHNFTVFGAMFIIFTVL